MLLTLVTSSQFSTVIHVLSCVVPLFIATPQYLLDNERLAIYNVTNVMHLQD